jgi:D-alanyl-D-alanine dipeptidase
LKLEEAKERAIQFVSDPDVFSPHLTGGAVDVALVDPNGSFVAMGNLVQHNDTAETIVAGLTKEQQDNRALLISVMTKAGFVNYPYEWWHWSFGDKYWGYRTGKTAIYDSIIIKEHANIKKTYRNIKSTARWLINKFSFRKT